MKTLHWLLMPGIVCALLAAPLSAQTRGRVTSTKIDPKTPIKDLLPTPPQVIPRYGPELGDDLGKVPEVEFQALGARQTLQRIVDQIARISHLNSKKQDGFLEALLAERRDLQGLPFAMGDACRLSPERSKEFGVSATNLRELMRKASDKPDPAARFWDSYRIACAMQDARADGSNFKKRDDAIRARLAALMQVMAPERSDVLLGLVNHLAATRHPEAIRNLARLAIFCEDEEVANAAVAALRVRHQERDYADILSQGLHYPWPSVAQRTATVVVKLDRKDMIPELLDVLESKDPRLPRTKVVDGKQTQVARELVKLNHQRNCLMCHGPATDGKLTADTLVVAVPLESEPKYYQECVPNRSIRVDVTYLRQDFSNMQVVAGANGPEIQRFDYLVQTRTLNREEAALYREKLAIRAPGQSLSPYQEAAQEALRKLTGKNAEPNASAWRKVLRANAGVSQ